MVREHFDSPNLNIVNLKFCFLGFVVWDRPCMYSVFAATLTQMTRFSIVYKHQWLPCWLRMFMSLSCLWMIWTAIIRSGCGLWPWTVAAATTTMSRSLQSVGFGPTHSRSGTLNLLMTDVPDLRQVAVVATIGNSDHSSLSAVLSISQAVPNLCVSWKVFQKY